VQFAAVAVECQRQTCLESGLPAGEMYQEKLADNIEIRLLCGHCNRVDNCLTPNGCSRPK
jgi:hypothetical protein